MRIRKFCAALLMGTALAGPTLADDNVAVETVIVTGAKTASSSKAPIPLAETPQNIQVLSSELLLDQGDHLLDEALRNVAGVMPGGYYTGFDYFRIRGFDASGFIYLDGLLYDSGISTNAELFGLDQVEVVKGPASSLYGQGAPGGLVNLVSKRPRDDSFVSASAGYGSFDSFQFTLDGGTRLTDGVDARLVGVARRDGTFVDFVNGDTRLYFAPSLKWEIDEDTTLTLLTGVQNDHMSFGFPLPAEGTVFDSPYGRVPLSRFNGEPDRSNRLDETRARFGYELRHRFDDVFSFSQNFRFGWADTDWQKLLYPAFLDDSTALIEARYPFGLKADWTNVNVDTSLAAEFSTGAVQHTLIAGVDYYDYDYDTHYSEIDYNDLSQYMYLDLIHPVYGTPVTPYSSFTHNIDHTTALGLYVQEHARIDRFTLTAGLRWDDALDDAIYSNVPQKQEKYQLVPRVGATFDVTPDVAAYGSYSQSFKPQLGYANKAGNALDPETGQQWEAGLKAQLFDGRLNATAAVYQLTRQHVAVADSTGLFYFQTGEQRSRGFELDSQMVISKGWELIASYAHTEAEVTKDNDPAMLGDGSLNVPTESFSFWTKYGIEDGMLRGLSFSAGVNAYSDQWGDLPNTFKLPGYVLVNGNVEYTWRNYTFLLNLKNITNERYFVGSYNDLYVNPGAPRSALFSVTWKN
ncbi:MAG TPA: TonB-dependent siderophore receptor [Rhizomicrobium sp.]|nr:TonB-dependent siderophore receptor [Rhizomicrobium sp.]